MEDKILIALISAGSAILASSITQVIGFISKNSIDKRIDHREYRNNRITSYQSVFEIVDYMNETMMDDTEKWAGEIVTKLEKLIIKNGIWLDKDDIQLLKKLQHKISDISANDFMMKTTSKSEFEMYKKDFSERFTGSIITLQDEILSKTRTKVRELYGI